MYRKQVRRRRAVLALAVAASIALLTGYFGEGAGGALHSIQRGFVTAFSPVEQGASRALKPVRDLVGWVDDTTGAKGENERLRTENAELRRRLADAEAASVENNELRSLVQLPRRAEFPNDYDPVSARVIARSPTVWFATITVDRGTSSGVQRDDVVVTGDGLVGRVDSVTSGSSVVRLITNPDSAVSVVVTPRRGGESKIGGVLKPRVGDPSDMLVDFIERGRLIREGWLVTTAGWRSGELESLFPPGIPVGRVIKADVSEQETYQRVHIEPFADVRSVEFVQVLTGGERNRSSGQQLAEADPAAVGP